jgi:hypothetical protein
MRPACAAVALIIAVAVAGCKSTTREPEPTPPERTDIRQITRPIPPREPLPGTDARTALLFTKPIPALNALVEVREYFLNEGKELTLTLPSEALFEIRSGKFDVAAPKVKGVHSTGTMWTARPGEHVTVKTTSQLAILRATYVVKE